ncbi:MAG: hypothetical protein AUH86_11350 [Acidobacteria bacterium 13_1_40CM_4_58_4]|nr:MAG: hypothetical protein AUH86_11350 [Acidobacteria bacterium 13_1_40CM_4_58_4]
MSSVQEIELIPNVEIKQALHDVVRRDNACVHACVAQLLFHFYPFLIVPNFWASQWDGEPSLRDILRAWLQDRVGRLFRS